MTTSSPQETQQFAAKFLKNHLQSNVLALYGDLGSGKTTFVQGLAAALGVDEPVTSPTFIILKNYGRLYHLDLYRVSSWEDVKMLELPEIWDDEKNLVVIEWPDRIEKQLPDHTQKLKFEYLGEARRKITAAGSNRG